MKFSARKSYTFYPNILDNLALPENERLSVEIIRPAAEDRGNISYLEYEAITDKITPVIRYNFDSKNILNRCVGEIKNLEIENTDGTNTGKQIKSGKELAKESFYGMGALVDAICTEVCTDVLTDSQKKIS